MKSCLIVVHDLLHRVSTFRAHLDRLFFRLSSSFFMQDACRSRIEFFKGLWNFSHLIRPQSLLIHNFPEFTRRCISNSIYFFLNLEHFCSFFILHLISTFDDYFCVLLESLSRGKSYLRIDGDWHVLHIGYLLYVDGSPIEVSSNVGQAQIICFVGTFSQQFKRVLALILLIFFIFLANSSRLDHVSEFFLQCLQLTDFWRIVIPVIACAQMDALALNFLLLLFRYGASTIYPTFQSVRAVETPSHWLGHLLAKHWWDGLTVRLPWSIC